MQQQVAYVVFEYDRIDHESIIKCVYLDKEIAEDQVEMMNKIRYNQDYEYLIKECPIGSPWKCNICGNYVDNSSAIIDS